MSKPQSTPTAISGTDLRRYLETQDDFALEREAYRHAKGFGFKASHGGLYDDPKTNKRRQYDIRASFEGSNRSIQLTIECKALSPAYPLLVQRVPRAGDESFHQVMQSRESLALANGVSSEPQGWMGAGLFKMVGTHLYDSLQPVGKSLKRVKVDGGGFTTADADIYDKYTQALSSMDELVQSAAVGLRAPRSDTIARAFLPIIVISDEALWVADYDASGRLVSDPRPEPDETTFYLGWNYELPNSHNPAHPATFTISHLQIMTRRRLPKFLSEIQNDGRIWQKLFGA